MLEVYKVYTLDTTAYSSITFSSCVKLYKRTIQKLLLSIFTIYIFLYIICNNLDFLGIGCCRDAQYQENYFALYLFPSHLFYLQSIIKCIQAFLVPVYVLTNFLSSVQISPLSFGYPFFIFLG